MNEKSILVTQSFMPPYEEYIQAIKPLWDSHWITNMGQYHQELECRLKDYLDVPELSLTVNGHMALELVVQAMGFPENSEVITSPFTFVSTTHAIVRNRLKPVFCDVKLEDGTIDESKIENLITDNTVAIVPIHVYGNICNIEKIQQIADKYKLKVIYDAAHAFGVTYKDKGIGNYGDASIFSFHATKIFHTIEGGAVASNDHKLYEKIYNLKNFGIRGEETVCEVGANAKMNEFCAIMGLCNLNHIETILKRRKYIYNRYKENLADIKGIRFLERNKDANENHSYFPVLIEDDYGISRDELYKNLKKDSIYTRKYFYPITADYICFKGEFQIYNLNNAREISRKILTLPLYNDLKIEDISYITKMIRR